MTGARPFDFGGQWMRLTPHMVPRGRDTKENHEPLEGPAVGDWEVFPFLESPLTTLLFDHLFQEPTSKRSTGTVEASVESHSCGTGEALVGGAPANPHWSLTRGSPLGPLVWGTGGA